MAEKHHGHLVGDDAEDALTSIFRNSELPWPILLYCLRVYYHSVHWGDHESRNISVQVVFIYLTNVSLLYFISFVRKNTVHRATRSRSLRLRNVKILLGAVLCCTAAQAHALPLIALAPQSFATLPLAFAGQNFCFQYTYDANGNRLTSLQGNVQSGGAVWGSSTFGCSIWGQSL